MIDRLAGMAVFAKVVEAESFTAAASQLGMSKSAVSKAVTALEDRLGARLLNRTTRRLALTEAGRAFYESCARIVADVEQAEIAVAHLQQTPRGVLRVNAGVSFGIRHVGPAVPDFMALHPEIAIEMELTDRYVDLIEEGFDVVVRIANDLQDSSLIARKLADNAMVIAATPAYWARHSKPGEPRDLAGHACITYAYNPSPRDWPFVDVDGRRFTARVAGRLHTNNGDASLCAALAGQGVVRLPRFICGPALAAGALEAVLQEWMPPPAGIYAMYPHSRHLSSKVRVFVDFLVARFNEACDWDRPPGSFTPLAGVAD